jgi:hypothetical protein
MAFYTKSEARIAANLKKNVRTISAESILDSVNKSAKTTDSFDVFLSHSSKDADLVLGVMALLEDQGLKVYVDWHSDPQMKRENVTSETAELLRTRMKQSRSLVYLATENSSSSKWMPWELGYFDAFSSGSVAILPLLDTANDSFKGQEYHGIYPLVNKQKTQHQTKAIVSDSKRKWLELKSFGQGSRAWNSPVY